MADLLWDPLTPLGECRPADFAEVNDIYIEFSAVHMSKSFLQKLETESTECRSADKCIRFSVAYMSNIFGQSRNQKYHTQQIYLSKSGFVKSST